MKRDANRRRYEEGSGTKWLIAAATLSGMILSLVSMGMLLAR